MRARLEVRNSGPRQRVWGARRRLATFVVLTAIAASAIGAVPDGDIADVKGTATKLFSADDAGILAVWDVDRLELGGQGFGIGDPSHSYLSDDQGRITLCAHGESAVLTTEELDLETAVGTPANAVKVKNTSTAYWARLRERDGHTVTRMTFPDIPATAGTQLSIEYRFKEPTGNDDTMHFFLADSETGVEYESAAYTVMRSSAGEGTYSLSTIYPLAGANQKADLIIELRQGAADTLKTSKVFIDAIYVNTWTPSTGTTGIMRYDPADDSFENLHDRDWAWEETGRYNLSPISAVISAPFTNALVQEGDLLFLQNRYDRTGAGEFTDVFAIDPDGQDEATLIATLPGQGFEADLQALSTGELIVLGLEDVFRVDYDEDNLTYSDVLVPITSDEVFAMVVGPDDLLYVAMRDTSPNDRSKEIYQIDPLLAPYTPLSYATAKYHVGRTRSLTFDSDGVMWYGGWKNNAPSPYFFGKRKSSGKIDYKKRLVEWDAGVRSIIAAPDGDFHALTNLNDVVDAMWRIEK